MKIRLLTTSLAAFIALSQLSYSFGNETADSFLFASISDSNQWFESTCKPTLAHHSFSKIVASEASEFQLVENPCSSVAQLACRFRDDYACEMYLLHSELRKASHWAIRPLIVNSATAEVVEYLGVYYRMQRRLLQPISAKHTPLLVSTISRIKLALSSMPKSIYSVFIKYVSAVLLVENLGPKNETLDLYDEVGRPVSGLIVLDLNELQQKANEWLSKRESSPYIPMVRGPNLSDSALGIKAFLEEDQNDVLENSIQFILLRELGHILFDAFHDFPSDTEASKEDSIAKSPFLTLSWFVNENEFHNRFDQSFAKRALPTIYPDDPNQRRDMGEMAMYYYDILETLPFPSILATTDVREDFAESFAGYVHTVIQKKPFTIVLKPWKDFVPRKIPSCWDQPRCSTKRRFFDELIASWSSETRK